MRGKTFTEVTVWRNHHHLVSIVAQSKCSRQAKIVEIPIGVGEEGDFHSALSNYFFSPQNRLRRNDDDARSGVSKSCADVRSQGRACGIIAKTWCPSP